MQRFNFKDITGKRFGMLTAEWPAGTQIYGRQHYTVWFCLCDCGQLTYKNVKQLTRHKNENCGCKHGNYKHGLAQNKRVEYKMWKSAHGRARKLNLPFDIKPSDILVPKECPLLNIPIAKQPKQFSDNSPTLDRKEPALGYTKENIWVISYRANRMKNSASLAELKTFIENCQKELYGEQLFSNTKSSFSG